jgi:tartrate dehydrogenase/decarboxylase/D-malate dehydrogenase
VRRLRIASLAGDGVGREVVPVGQQVLAEAARLDGRFALEFEELPWGSEYYAKYGRMMPEDGLRTLRNFDAIYLGAVGSPTIPDHVTLWGLLLPIRQRFNQYVNLRPVRLLPGVVSPLRDKEPRDIDMICVRENTEGEYAGVGGRVHVGFDHEVALQTDVFTRVGVEKVGRYAFEQARMRSKKLASITKSNASPYSYVLWDEVIAELGEEYPDIAVTRMLVDAAAGYFVSRPEIFDVVVASNLFADILTDIGAAIQGSMGLAASANINPDGGYPGMFEPVHGSAPDIAGRGIANPIGVVWAGSLMLDELGCSTAAARVMDAVADVLGRQEVRTPDLGGESGTSEVGDALVDALRARADGGAGPADPQTDSTGSADGVVASSSRVTTT